MRNRTAIPSFDQRDGEERRQRENQLMDYYTEATVKTKFIWLMMEKEMEDMV